MKRVTLLLLSLSVVTPALTGCQSSSNNFNNQSHAAQVQAMVGDPKKRSEMAAKMGAQYMHPPQSQQH